MVGSSLQDPLVTREEIAVKRSAVVRLEEHCQAQENNIRELVIVILREKENWRLEGVAIDEYKEKIDKYVEMLKMYLPNNSSRQGFEENVKNFRRELAIVAEERKWPSGKLGIDLAVSEYNKRIEECVEVLKSSLLKLGCKNDVQYFRGVSGVYVEMVKLTVLKYNRDLTHGKNKGTDGLPDYLIAAHERLARQKHDLAQTKDRITLLRAEIAQFEGESQCVEMAGLVAQAAARYGVVNGEGEEHHIGLGLGGGF